MTGPLPFQWDGEAMVPAKRFQAECDKRFVIGEMYILEQIEARSAASHRHYFAAINEAWSSLSQDAEERFPTPEHLRKYALIKAGYRDERTIVASSRAEALRLAGFVKPIDSFAIVVTDGPAVIVWTAQSQSMRAMGKQKFQESKDRVLEVVSDLIGTTPDMLNSHASAA